MKTKQQKVALFCCNIDKNRHSCFELYSCTYCDKCLFFPKKTPFSFWLFDETLCKFGISFLLVGLRCSPYYSHTLTYARSAAGFYYICSHGFIIAGEVFSVASNLTPLRHTVLAVFMGRLRPMQIQYEASSDKTNIRVTDGCSNCCFIVFFVCYRLCCL